MLFSFFLILHNDPMSASTLDHSSKNKATLTEAGMIKAASFCTYQEVSEDRETHTFLHGANEVGTNL